MRSVKRKNILSMIIVLLASGLMVTKTSSASDSMAKPSVPEFTVKFVNSSYTVTTTNPYTGINESKLVSNDSIEIIIKNQPFLGYSNDYRIYFNVRAKPHFEGNWTEIYRLQNLTSSYNADGAFSFAEYVSHDSPTQSNSSYTNITFPVVPTELYQASGYDIQRYHTEEGVEEGVYFAFLSAIPYEGQLDFQVEALVGHGAQVYVNDHPLAPYPIGHYGQAIAFDTTSGWSNTQTIKIGGHTSAATPTSGPSTEATTNTWETWQSALVTGIVIAVVLAVSVLLVYWRKRRLQAPNTSNHMNQAVSE
jgi:hypothetical protein